MQTPSPDDVRARSDLLAQTYPSDDSTLTERLQALLDDDAPVVSELTGRMIGPDGTPGIDVPDYLKPVARRAMAMRAERFTVGGTAKKRRGTINALSLRSFTAGPYSESYFGPGEAAQARALDPDPAIHELLWALATPDMRAQWLYQWGIEAPLPAAALQPFPRRQRPPSRIPGPWGWT